MLIHKAQRKKAKLRLGIYGISNSGKTYSSLLMANGIGGKIGLIDSEHGRGELYSKEFDYDVISIEAPYSVEKYIEAIKDFENANYDILIIDSLSHAWSGEGGLVEAVSKLNGNSFQNWGRVGTPLQQRLLDAIMGSKMHVFATMRTKAEYAISTDDKGKMKCAKLGLGPVQKDGIEYEFTVLMSMDKDNRAEVIKDNTRLFLNQYIQPTEKTGKAFIDWLNEGVDERDQFINGQCKEILNRINNAIDQNDLRNIYGESYKIYSSRFPKEFEAITRAKDARKNQFSVNLVEVEIANSDSYAPIALAS